MIHTYTSGDEVLPTRGKRVAAGIDYCRLRRNSLEKRPQPGDASAPSGRELKNRIAPAAKRFFLVFRRVFAATVFLVGAALSQLTSAQAATISFVGGTTGDRITFRISLPPSYLIDEQRSYPVIYHLHGKGGDYESGTNVDQAYRPLMARGRIPEVIVVYPDGDDDSFWANSFDGQRLIESEVIQDIITYVDANFRTIADRNHRIVTGFSMGGFGAMDYAMKFPRLFRAVISFDGAILTWDRLLELERSVAASMFNNDEEYFDRYSPYANATKNRDLIIRNDVKLLIIVGEIIGDNKNWSDHLDSLGISYEKRFTGCEHRLGCLLDSKIDILANFLAENLQ